MISTGTARKNSTNTAHAQLTARTGESLPMPRAQPSTNANTMDTAAAVSVPSIPGST